MKEKTIAEMIGGCIGLIIVALLIGAFNAWMLEIAWNYVVPQAFHGPTITFWVAYAMIALLSVIAGFFKSSPKKAA